MTAKLDVGNLTIELLNAMGLDGVDDVNLDNVSEVICNIRELDEPKYYSRLKVINLLKEKTGATYIKNSETEKKKKQKRIIKELIANNSVSSNEKIKYFAEQNGFKNLFSARTVYYKMVKAMSEGGE